MSGPGTPRRDVLELGVFALGREGGEEGVCVGVLGGLAAKDLVVAGLGVALPLLEVGLGAVEVLLAALVCHVFVLGRLIGGFWNSALVCSGSILFSLAWLRMCSALWDSKVRLVYCWMRGRGKDHRTTILITWNGSGG